MKRFLKSIFTDGQWDGDAAKVFGIVLILVGIVGWWMGKSDFQWIIGFGTGLVGTGKFSAQG